MSIAEVLAISRDLFYTTLLLAIPTLTVGLLVGLIISILQTITSIQEQTLTFVPRLLAVGIVLVFTTTWSLQIAVHFTVRMLEFASKAAR